MLLGLESIDINMKEDDLMIPGLETEIVDQNAYDRNV